MVKSDSPALPVNLKILQALLPVPPETRLAPVRGTRLRLAPDGVGDSCIGVPMVPSRFGLVI
jgi:hypothetical protein